MDKEQVADAESDSKLNQNDKPAEAVVADGTVQQNDEDMLQRIKHLEQENSKMQSGFNAQRAKMKDLFVQKEKELNELKTKLILAEVKAQEEISSLQQLVQDTIEESAICKTELEHIRGECKRLLQENGQLKENSITSQQHQQSISSSTQEFSSLGPQVFVKNLVRKLGGDSQHSSHSHHPPASIVAQEQIAEDKAKAGDGRYAHEDSEVLSSIVLQLQEEMKVLKEKLREADEKLQTTQLTSAARNQQITTTQCNNCFSFEEKMQELLGRAVKDQEKIENMQKEIEEAAKDLEKEAALRSDLENQWQEKREVHKTEVHQLREQVTSNEQQLLELQQKFLETKDEVMRKLQSVACDREKVNKHLETLQADNDFLSGRYLATAEEIENQYINLPNNVEELHELILQQQNELIQARLGCDFEKKKGVSSLDEIQILRQQLEASNNDCVQYKRKYQTEMKSMQDRITQHMKTLQSCEAAKVALERKESDLQKQVSTFRVEIIELQEQNEKLSKQFADAKSKIKNLQDDLTTSETVQKDFVQLSQTLQMTLEQLRHADSEVRWQDEDDVSNCPACNIHFAVTIRKLHCRHCGHIYCEKCLAKTVESGPRKRPARVCNICHTLLRPNIAPYFSQDSSLATSSQQQQQQQQQQTS